MEFNSTAGIAETLKAVQNAQKQVEVHLKGGQILTGTVGGVGRSTLVLSQLQGRETFDALMLLEEISGIVVQIREAAAAT